MNVYCLTTIFSFIHNTIAFIEITGELTFDINPAESYNVKHGKIYTKLRDRNIQTYTFEKKVMRDRDGILSEAEKVEPPKVNKDCLYKYPDKKQMEALLSDMMNQLTMIFIRAYDFIGKRDRRSNHNHKRFHIVTKHFNTSFFEQAYNLMTKEYRHTVLKTGDFNKFSNHNPCHHQADVKRVWLNLLDRSKSILKRAAVRCVSDFLRIRNRVDDTSTKEKVGELLLREIKEVRSNQLKVLCEEFKLCYKDLL